jgi:hypothetical protein
MNVTIKDWGIPDGIAGSIISDDPIIATKEANKILFYKMKLSIIGGYFELLKESHHTDEDVNKAEEWLRKNHDVVSIKVFKELGN